MGTPDAGRSTTWGGRSTTWGGRGRLAAAVLTVSALVAPLTGAAATATTAQPPSLRVPLTASQAAQPVELTGANSQNARGAGSERKAHKDRGGVTRLSVRDLVAPAGTDKGRGRTIAVVDSGVAEVPGLSGRVVQGYDATGTGFTDEYGHGTFVAGLAAGDGVDSSNKQTGILGVAPHARIVSVKVSDANGKSTVGQVVDGLSWVLANHQRVGIDVVALALAVKTDDPQSYDANPINALVEALWFSGVTVVASAGNEGRTVAGAPGNDPFIITTGTVHDANTVTTADDTLSPFSNTGQTADGVAKPEVTTVGQHVQAPMPVASKLYQKQTVEGLPRGYGQMSGTSMSTGVLAGAAAVLLGSADGPRTPTQVKSRLVSSLSGPHGQLDLAAAATPGRSVEVNVGLRPSAMLAVAYAQRVLGTTDYAAVAWADVTWSDVTWSNVTWSDVTWSDVTWSSTLSPTATWSSATWSSATWSSATWSSATWSSAHRAE